MTISHSHGVPNNSIIKFLNNISPPIFVSYRNLADSIVSRRDMLINDEFTSELLSPSAVHKFKNGSKSYQLDLIIDLFASRYLNFYTGWKNESSSRNIFFIKYSELVNNKIKVFTNLAIFFDLNTSKEKIRESVSKIAKSGGVNYNKGEKSRGKRLLNKNQKRKWKNIAAKFDVDDEKYLGI